MVGQGIEGRFCAESQPDGGKTGFNHFHRLNTPASGDTSMHGPKGEEGYWLKHVAVADFEMGSTGEHGEGMHYKPGHRAGCAPAADTQLQVAVRCTAFSF